MKKRITFFLLIIIKIILLLFSIEIYLLIIN